MISKNLKTSKERLLMEITENDRNSHSIIIIFKWKYDRACYKPDLGACLKSKRIASRELNPERVVFSCKIVKAKVELDEQTKYGKRIVKVLDD